MTMILMEVVLGTAAPENLNPNQRKSAEPGSGSSALVCVQGICRVPSMPLFGIQRNRQK